MEYFLRDIIEFLGKNPRLRRVCSVWKEYIDVNDNEILDGLYYQYNPDRDIHIHDVVLLAAKARDTHSIYKLYNQYNQFLPVDWVIIASEVQGEVKDLIIPHLLPSQVKDTEPLPSPIDRMKPIIRGLGNIPIPQNIIDMVEKDDLISLQEGKYTQNTTSLPLVSLSVVYGAKKIYDYMKVRRDVSVELIALADGKVLEEMCRDPKFYTYMFEVKGISVITHYKILSSILSYPMDDSLHRDYLKLHIDILAIAMSKGYASLIDKYVSQDNILQILTSRFFDNKFHQRTLRVLSSKGLFHKDIKIYLDGKRPSTNNIIWKDVLESAFLSGNTNLVLNIIKLHKRDISATLIRSLTFKVKEIYDESLLLVVERVTGSVTNGNIQKIIQIMKERRFDKLLPYNKYLLESLSNYMILTQRYGNV